MHTFGTLLPVGILLLALLAVAGVFSRSFSWKTGKPFFPGAYQPLPALLSPAERSFFGILTQAVAVEYRIFAKVRLADIVKPTANSSRSRWQSDFNRISRKHVDFVVCDLSSLTVLVVIELDDQSHQRFERRIRDGFVDSVLASARIPVLRVRARESYSPLQIREELKQIIHTSKGFGEQVEPR